MEWWAHLASIRRAQRLSQEALARLIPVSVSSLTKYETGTRHPSRTTLVRMLDVLHVAGDVRDEILVGAGYPADGSTVGRGTDYLFSRTEALADLARHDWPAAVLDEFMQVLGANRLLQCIWGVDPTGETSHPVERNLLSLMSHAPFATRLVNWTDVVAAAVATLKGHQRGAHDLQALSPYFRAVIERFTAGIPERVAMLDVLWETTPPRPPRIRWSFPVVWQLDGLPPMQFEILVSVANDDEGLVLHDWIPRNAQTWESLEIARGRIG